AVFHFLAQVSEDTLATGLLGGPWAWFHAGDGAEIAAPSGTATIPSTIAVLIVIVVTVAIRPRAVRAWVMAIAYVAIVCALIAVPRLGTQFAHGIEGLAPRYVADTIPVLALAIGVAFFGVAGERDPVLGLARAPVVRQRIPAFATIAALLLGASTAYSFAGFTDPWSVKIGRNSLDAAQADLSHAPPGTVFFDEPVPDIVVLPLFYPDSLESHV